MFKMVGWSVGEEEEEEERETGDNNNLNKAVSILINLMDPSCVPFLLLSGTFCLSDLIGSN